MLETVKTEMRRGCELLSGAGDDLERVRAGVERANAASVALSEGLFYATDSGSVSYRVFDPNGKEVNSSSHQYGAWCDACKSLKPYKNDDTWY
jgi:hypothetical protein